MKRLLLFCVVCAFAFVAHAQVRKFYYVGEYYWVKVDLDKKEFLADGCGTESDPISNYKKVGNKETFTSYNGGYTTHHEFVKKSETEYSYTYWRTPCETIEKSTIEVTTKEPSAAVDEGVKDNETGKVVPKKPTKTVGNGVKGLLNKGKGLFKKDKSNPNNSNKSNNTPQNAPIDDGSLPEK